MVYHFMIMTDLVLGCVTNNLLWFGMDTFFFLQYFAFTFKTRLNGPLNYIIENSCFMIISSRAILHRLM